MTDYVYLSGPITGLAYAASDSWRRAILPHLANHIVALSPMRGKDYLSEEDVIMTTYEDIPMSSQRGIVTRDRNDIIRCDALIGNLAGAPTISLGTVFEYAWANMLRKPIVTILSDSAWSAHTHNHAFMRESTDYIVDSIEDAAHIVNTLLWNN